MTPQDSDQLILFRVGAVRDAWRVNARPGALAVRGGRIVAAGELGEVQRIAGKPDRVIDRPDLLVLPAMVNAHAHLDLTNLGPRPYGGNFIDWLRSIIQSRQPGDEQIENAVRKGLAMSRESGVGGLADIAGSLAAVKARLLAEAPLQVRGGSFLEVLGFGDRGRANVARAIADLDAIAGQPRLHDDRVALRLEPHAPYSTGEEVYAVAGHYYEQQTTHLAETPEEAQFIRDGAGPFADLLRNLGRWDASIRPRGVSPVQYLAPQFDLWPGQWFVAHCNYVDDADIGTLAESATPVVYCPVASDYFRHQNHRYRDMIAAGVIVCLGTDSIVCQPADEPQPLGILPQMRHLYRRDRTDPAVLLAMATVKGSVPRCGVPTLTAGEPADCIAVRFDPDDHADPLTQVLMNREPATPLSGRAEGSAQAHP